MKLSWYETLLLEKALDGLYTAQIMVQGVLNKQKPRPFELHSIEEDIVNAMAKIREVVSDATKTEE